jgi:hypothetical protein
MKIVFCLTLVLPNRFFGNIILITYAGPPNSLICALRNYKTMYTMAWPKRREELIAEMATLVYLLSGTFYECQNIKICLYNGLELQNSHAKSVQCHCMK